MNSSAIKTTTATAAKTLRILCFGDSLTSGWTNGGAASHPYSKTFQTRLAADSRFISAYNSVQITTRGIPGEWVINRSRGSQTTVPGMVNRLSKTLELAKLQGEPFDVVFILGGTNDLDGGADPKVVFEEGLRTCYEMAMDEFGAYVVGLTIIGSQCSVSTNTPTGARRHGDILNDLILNYKPSATNARFHAFDLARAFPYYGLTRAERQQVWDDNFHPTKEGYNQIGELIFEDFASCWWDSSPP
ncbi:hypothetical protein HK102_006260 [Quaeritorhiza haematococci]|nr:hypothetical protein HK102_006260 [Quaeritorhiza haematococci]